MIHTDRLTVAGVAKNLGVPFDKIFRAYTDEVLIPDLFDRGGSRNGVPTWYRDSLTRIAALLDIPYQAKAADKASGATSQTAPAKRQSATAEASTNVLTPAIRAAVHDAIAKHQAAAKLEFNFKPMPIRQGKATVVHSAESLAKAIGASSDEVGLLLSSGRLQPIQSQGNSFMFSIESINQLLSKKTV